MAPGEVPVRITRLLPTKLYIGRCYRRRELMPDGREEREEQQKRREQESQQEKQDHLEPEEDYDWEPEVGGS